MSEQSLTDVKRRAASEHILTATRKFVVAHGLAATMDELALAAGVSRTTLFRLFASRERLIAAAFAAGMDNYEQVMPVYDGDADVWLHSICQAAHRLNASAGPGYWELTSRDDLPPDLADLDKERVRSRREWVVNVSRMLWKVKGGDGNPPPSLVTTVGAHLSSHFTAGVLTDVGESPEIAAELAYQAIQMSLDQLTSEFRS